MSEDGKRPGGLTALAVLNFVFGGLGALALLALFAVIGAVANSAQSTGVEVKSSPGAALAWTNLLLATLTVGLLITSGVGYLGLKRFLGRTMGNAYALVSLASSAIGISIGGFGIYAMIGLVYPLLTVALINTTFKDDLVR